MLLLLLFQTNVQVQISKISVQLFESKNHVSFFLISCPSPNWKKKSYHRTFFDSRFFCQITGKRPIKLSRLMLWSLYYPGHPYINAAFFAKPKNHAILDGWGEEATQKYVLQVEKQAFISHFLIAYHYRNWPIFVSCGQVWGITRMRVLGPKYNYQDISTIIEIKPGQQ